MAPPLLIAAGLDWLEALLPLLFVLFWIVSQIRNLFRAAGGDARPARPIPERAVPRPPEDEDASRELARQIEEFMRRSGGERAPSAPAGQRPGPRSRPVETPAELRRRQPPPRQPAKRRQPSAPPPLPAPPAEPPLGALGGHAADISRHVHDAFAQELEHLPAGLASPASAASAPAGIGRSRVDIATLLRSPATLRDLVLIREVLDRPVDRW